MIDILFWKVFLLNNNVHIKKFNNVYVMLQFSALGMICLCFIVRVRVISAISSLRHLSSSSQCNVITILNSLSVFHYFLKLSMLFTAGLSNILWLHFPSCSILSLISPHFPSSYLFASGFSCLRFIEDRLCFCLLFSLFGMIFWKRRVLEESYVLWHKIRSDLYVFKIHLMSMPHLHETFPHYSTWTLKCHSCSTYIIEQYIMFDFVLL